MEGSHGTRFGLQGMCLLLVGWCILAPWSAMADLPIHTTIRDVKGKWTFFLTPPVSGAIHTCGSGAPNKNTDNLQPSIADSQAYLKSHGGVASTLELQLADETIPFSDVRDTSANAHRGGWRTLAVKDVRTNEAVGGWTTVYDEGFEVTLRDGTRLMAFMKYTKNDSCPDAKDGDLEDPNGRTACYTTDASKTQLGWHTKTAENGIVNSGCFYAEKSGSSSEALAPASFVYVREQKAEGGEKALRSSNSGLAYYLSKEFVDSHNGKLSSTWRAIYDSSFIQQHRTVLSSLLKDFGFSKVNSIDGFEAIPSFLQGENDSAGSVSSQLYACPCKTGMCSQTICLLAQVSCGSCRSAGEAVQDTRGVDFISSPVLSPVSMLQSTTTDVDVKEHQQESAPDIGTATSAFQANGLPKAFSWPNPFTDPSFVEHSTNQGGCGSCYAIAAVYAFEKRFDIAVSKLLGQKVSVFGGTQEQSRQSSFLEKSYDRLSPQSIVSCSFYNQGCHGGFPYLVGKHAAEMGVLEEGCMPYTAMDGSSCPVLQSTGMKNSGAQSSFAAFLTADSQAESCHAGDRRFAKDYGYVGGCYECGQCAGEEKIMAEIYANGPVTAAFDAPGSLFSYTSGVFDTEGAPHARVCDNPSASGGPNGLNGWEFTNHAVNILGWGETEATESSPAQKYWIIRNTWGSNWGNRGYFLLARGKNAGGIESQASYIDPDFSRGMGRSLLEMVKERRQY